MLKKCMGDPSLIVQTENVQIKDNLSYEEIPVQILDRQVRKLRTKEVALVKVLWRNQFVEEATWEAEEDMKKIYPHLFESGQNSDQARGRLARRNVEPQEQGVPNAPNLQPQGEVTNVEFREAIRMLRQVVTNQVWQPRGPRQDEADTSRIREFLRMNPSSFTGSVTTEDLQNFIEELKKVFDVMHVVDTERVELAAYQLKDIARTWFDQWNVGRPENAPPARWACFEEAFLEHFFPRELKEAKVSEFLTLQQDFLSVYEYGLKFTQLSRYAPEMGKDIRIKMRLFIAGLGRLSSKEGRAAMLIGDMDISRLSTPESVSSTELSKPGQGSAWGQRWCPNAGHVQGVGSGVTKVLVIEDMKGVVERLVKILMEFAHRKWMYDRTHPNRAGLRVEFINGVKEFIAKAKTRDDFFIEGTIRCPYAKCKCIKLLKPDKVEFHILKKGFMNNYYVWTVHGENDAIVANVDFQNAYNGAQSEPNDEAKRFYEQLTEANRPLYKGSMYSKLSVVVRLLSIKSDYSIAKAWMDSIIGLMNEVNPNKIDLPKDFYTTKTMVSKLGLSSEWINCCEK
ncbi:hypothetical protein MTR67_012476, partial [Solanum verrucosum]